MIAEAETIVMMDARAMGWADDTARKYPPVCRPSQQHWLLQAHDEPSVSTDVRELAPRRTQVTRENERYLSVLKMSASAFQSPPFCFFQITTYFPGMVMGEP
jgi:hypothetical protein